MSEADLIRDFLAWSQDLPERTLVGQNVAYDRAMLAAAAERTRANWNLAYRTVDVHTLCWMHIVKMKGRPPIDEAHKRSALNPKRFCSIVGYKRTVSTQCPHRRPVHAEVTARLLYDRKLLPEFKEYDIPWL